ncbi:hypothetical protein FNV43_RR11276 [Rhamnella rubrinervis]|uniref:Uncharacterized protein n=1 Tax=Rhamnella rubrinervis TaxID=2594499 RepID=A0A8K0H5D7_9ROSA|nr:hypothetical protein FNV43_RR11276 [Rhamnella rubrinervis]
MMLPKPASFTVCRLLTQYESKCLKHIKQLPTMSLSPQTFVEIDTNFKTLQEKNSWVSEFSSEISPKTCTVHIPHVRRKLIVNMIET